MGVRRSSAAFGGTAGATCRGFSAATLCSLKKLAGTPSAELYNMSSVAHARMDVLTSSPDVQMTLSGEVGSQSLNTVDEDDADARHLLGPLLDDLGDGGPSTNRKG